MAHATLTDNYPGLLNTTLDESDGTISLSAGSVSAGLFSGAISPHGWSGTICYDTASFGIAFCAAVPNTTGFPGFLISAGSQDVVDNNLVLVAAGLPPNQFGIFVVSPAQGLTTEVGGPGGGTLCLGGTIGRFQMPGQILPSGTNGAFSLQVDLNTIPAGNAIVAVAPGDTLFFQAWHRDNTTAGSNFTAGVQVDFL